MRVVPGWALVGAPLHLVYPSARLVPQRVIVFREYLLTNLVKYT